MFYHNYDTIDLITFLLCSTSKCIGVLVNIYLLIHIHQKSKQGYGQMKSLILPIFHPLLYVLTIVLAIQVTNLYLWNLTTWWGNYHAKLYQCLCLQIVCEGVIQYLLTPSVSWRSYKIATLRVLLWCCYSVAYVIIQKQAWFDSNLLTMMYQFIPCMYHFYIAYPWSITSAPPHRPNVRSFSAWMSLYHFSWLCIYFIYYMSSKTRSFDILFVPLLFIVALCEVPFVCVFYAVLRAETVYWHSGGLLLMSARTARLLRKYNSSEKMKCKESRNVQVKESSLSELLLIDDDEHDSDKFIDNESFITLDDSKNHNNLKTNNNNKNHKKAVSNNPRYTEANKRKVVSLPGVHHSTQEKFNSLPYKNKQQDKDKGYKNNKESSVSHLSFSSEDYSDEDTLMRDSYSISNSDDADSNIGDAGDLDLDFDGDLDLDLEAGELNQGPSFSINNIECGVGDKSNNYNNNFNINNYNNNEVRLTLEPSPTTMSAAYSDNSSSSSSLASSSSFSSYEYDYDDDADNIDNVCCTCGWDNIFTFGLVTLLIDPYEEIELEDAVNNASSPNNTHVTSRYNLGLLHDADDTIVEGVVQQMIETNRRHLVHFSQLRIQHNTTLGSGGFSEVFMAKLTVSRKQARERSKVCGDVQLVHVGYVNVLMSYLYNLHNQTSVAANDRDEDRLSKVVKNGVREVAMCDTIGVWDLESSIYNTLTHYNVILDVKRVDVNSALASASPDFIDALALLDFLCSSVNALYKDLASLYPQLASPLRAAGQQALCVQDNALSMSLTNVNVTEGNRKKNTHTCSHLNNSNIETPRSVNSQSNTALSITNNNSSKYKSKYNSSRALAPIRHDAHSQQSHLSFVPITPNDNTDANTSSSSLPSVSSSSLSTTSITRASCSDSPTKSSTSEPTRNNNNQTQVRTDQVNVAVKFFTKFISLEADMVQTFSKETALHAALRHPNIVWLYGLCVCPPTIALVTELCVHGSLMDVIEKQINIRSKVSNEINKCIRLKEKLALMVEETSAFVSINNINSKSVDINTKSLTDLLTNNTAAELQVVDITEEELELDMVSRASTESMSSGSGSGSMSRNSSNHNGNRRNSSKSISSHATSDVNTSNQSFNSLPTIESTKTTLLRSQRRLVLFLSQVWTLRARLCLARDSAASIAFLHKRKVMHRDIKTPNYLVSADMRVKLSDFGLSRYMEHTMVEKNMSFTHDCNVTNSNDKFDTVVSISNSKISSISSSSLLESSSSSSSSLVGSISAFTLQSLDNITPTIRYNVNTDGVIVNFACAADLLADVINVSRNISHCELIDHTNNTINNNNNNTENGNTNNSVQVKEQLVKNNTNFGSYTYCHDKPLFPVIVATKKNKLHATHTTHADESSIQESSIDRVENVICKHINNIGQQTGFEKKLSLSTMTTQVGSEAWMAPEVLESGSDYSFPADVYSLGIVLYEIICIQSAPLDRDHTWQPVFPVEIPFFIRQLIVSCLDFCPQDRPTAQEVVDVLTLFIHLIDQDHLTQCFK